MANYKDSPFIMSFTAGEALTSDQFKFVKFSAEDTVIKTAAVTDLPCGILQNAPANGKRADVMLMGISKLSADEALAAGNAVGTSSDAQGQVVVIGTETTVYAVGQCVEPASAAAGKAAVLFACIPNRAA